MRWEPQRKQLSYRPDIGLICKVWKVGRREAFFDFEPEVSEITSNKPSILIIFADIAKNNTWSHYTKTASY